MSEVQVKESYLWVQVKAGLENEQTHLSRVENTAGTGISDISACHRGREVWLELKVFHSGWLHFRASQRSWILRRMFVGGSVRVVARDGDTLHVYNGADCVSAPSTVVKEGKSFKVSRANLPIPLISCDKPFRWDNVRRVIFDLP